MTEEQLPEDPLAALRAARVERDRLAELIRREMSEKAREGHLWTNGRCRDWDAYQAAEERLAALRREYGV